METKAISKPFWKGSLAETLTRLCRPNAPLRIAIVGIGNELRGDDAAGVRVARELQERVGAACKLPQLKIIDAGPAPENYTGALRRFQPDLILLIDAAEMNEVAGTVRCLAWDDTIGFSASTHKLPLSVLGKYLTAELDCEIVLVGIQPENIAVRAQLSIPVRQAVNQVTRELSHLTTYT